MLSTASVPQWLLRLDAFCNKHMEAFFFGIQIFFCVVITAFSAGYGWTRADTFIRSLPLYQHLSTQMNNDVLVNGYTVRAFILMFSTVYFVLFVNCAVSIYYEFMTESGGFTKIRSREKRIDSFARLSTHAVFAIPAALLLAFDSNNDPLRFVVLYMQIYGFQSTIITVNLLFMFCDESQWLARPLICIPLAIAVYIALFGTQCQFLGIVYTLVWSNALNGISYAIGVVGNSVSLYNCYKLVRGQAVTGKGYDAIVILLTGTAWVITLRSARKSTEISIYPDYEMYAKWIFTRYGSGCLFLFFWQLRSTFVTYRRIESEEARELVITTKVLLMEQRMTQKLLQSMVPPKIANDLSRGAKVPPEMYDFACVFFSDIVGFTAFAAVKTPLEVFAMLNRLFVIMDHCVSLFPALYKIETIGTHTLIYTRSFRIE